MKLFASIALISATCIAGPPHLMAGAKEQKHARHHQILELVNRMSAGERAKFRAARKRAMKDRSVQVANERRKRADAEYRQLLHKEMLKADPSLKPLLEAISELKQHDEF